MLINFTKKTLIQDAIENEKLQSKWLDADDFNF